jgi:hypothetical protein
VGLAGDFQNCFVPCLGVEIIPIQFDGWTQSDEITKQVVSQLAQAPIFQIPWGQNLLIISKASSTKEALFYVIGTISCSCHG